MTTTTAVSEYDQQAIDFLTKTGVEFSTQHVEYGRHFVNDEQSRHIFLITLKSESNTFSFRFGQSIANGIQEPTAYEVLTCLQKYEVGSFEDFCGDFGYDQYDEEGGGLNEESEGIYDALCEEYANVCDIWTPEEIEELAEIQ